MKTAKIILNTLIIAFLILSTSALFADENQGASNSESSLPEDPAKLLSQTVEYEPLKYTLGPEDVIQIDVRRHPEFSGKFTINSEGKIQFKFVGDIPIAGFNKVEAKEKLTNILSKFVIAPDIELTILQYRSKVIFIVGEVGAPGKYYMKADSISVRDAVVQAGLPTLEASMRRAQLITPSEDGRPEKERIDLYDLIYEGKLYKDRDMKPGDVLYVPATLFAKVTRILRPVAAPVTSGSTIERATTGGL